ncbi:hypothetical protein [Rhizobium binxianense]|uniref:hypothetical protein n=1 Tax=Rhizobium binxianense TaxID=3024242 RepID=UPI00234E95B6|nr:hypothetical protein [Rhizobium sp. BC56]MDC7741239.1 hypothetical protein [Rhizobium sp. BC56]
MLAPIKLGDPLYPLEERFVDGVRRERKRQDWDTEKQISLNIRTLEYHLQFPRKHGNPTIANMIDAYYAVDYEASNGEQKAAYDRLLTTRKSWL